MTRLLGMTREEFFNTYFTGQKELAVMAGMSAPERAQFLSRVLGYERIRGGPGPPQGAALCASRPVRRAARRRSAILAEIEAAEVRARERVAATAAAEQAACAARRPAEAAWPRCARAGSGCSGSARPPLKLEAELRVADHGRRRRRARRAA